MMNFMKKATLLSGGLVFSQCFLKSKDQEAGDNLIFGWIRPFALPGCKHPSSYI